MFWKKPEPKPSIWKKFKMAWIAFFFFVPGLGSIYGGYNFIQPDLHHFEQHYSAKAILWENGSLVTLIDTDRLPNQDTTIQLIVDGQHIHHLHFPNGVPDDFGKGYAIGKHSLPVSTQLATFPQDKRVTIRFIFNGFPMLSPVIFETIAPFIRGESLTEKDGVTQPKSNKFKLNGGINV